MTNLLKTNSKVYNDKMNVYLGLIIDFEGTLQEKINFVVNDFCSQANHPANLRKFPNDQQRLADFFLGLPSSIAIPFTNFEILETAKYLHGTNFLTEKEEDTIVKNFFSHMAMKVLRLNQKFNN
jgi:hypothetical protein